MHKPLCSLYLEKFVVGFGLTQLYVKLNFYGPQETIRTHQSSIVDSVRPGLITHIQFFKAQSKEEKPVAANSQFPPAHQFFSARVSWKFEKVNWFAIKLNLVKGYDLSWIVYQISISQRYLSYIIWIRFQFSGR